MALKLYADGELVYDSRLEDYKLLGLKTTEGVNKSGTAEFIMPPNHPAYNRFVSLRTVVTLYENKALRFRGRSLYPADDWLTCRTITCEGERGFFRDSVMRPYLFQDSPAAIFAAALELHNAEVDDFKRFTLGQVTVTDPNDYVRMESESAMTTAAFLDKLVERCGGYITFNDDGKGGRAVNWLAEIGTRSQQTIEFGENLLDFARSGQTTDLATAIRPYGAKLDETGERVTIESVTDDGADWIKDDEAVALRGVIVATQTWDDVTDPRNLLTKAKQWLGEHRLSITSLQLTAADLSKLDRNIGSYHVGDLVPVLSVPHGVDDYFQLTERTTDWLESTGDKVTLGKTKASLVGMDVAGDRQSASKLDKINQQSVKDIKNLAQQVTGLDTKVEGIDGLFFYVKYSAYADGHIMTDTPQADTQYIGTCSAKLKQNVAPTDYKAYTWAKIKGETGNGIKSVAQHYAVSTSNSQAPTSWSETVPTLTATNKYLWNYETVTYTDGSIVDTTKRVIGVYGDKGDTGNGIKSVAQHYAVSTSNSQAPTSWSETVPTLTATNKYLWNYETVTYTDGSIVDTTKRVIGVYGDKGTTGNGISKITEHYAVSTSNSQAPTSWSETVPTLTATNKYLWNYETVTYTDGSIVDTTKRVIGVYGDKGDTGKGIKSTSSTYQAGTSGTSAPTGTWLSSVPTVAAGQFLWTRTIITYTDGATSTSYSVGRMGVDGNNGTPGTNGKDGKTQYLHIKYSDDGKTFTANNGETLGAWIGTKVDFTEADSNTFSDYTWKKFTEDVDVGGRNLLVNTHYFQDASPIVLSSAANDNYVTKFDGFVLYTPNAVEPGTELTLQACTDAVWSSYHGYQDANSKKVVSMWLYWCDSLANAQSGSNYVNPVHYPADGASTGRFFWTFKAPAATATVSKWYACVRLNSYSDGSATVTHKVWDIKLERGNVPTDWTPSPEDVDEKIESSKDELKKTITAQYTQITNNCNEIILAALESYVQTGNYNEFKTTVESQLNVLAGAIEMNFNTTKESISTVDGDMQTKFEQLYKYISFAGNGITIGSGENAITLTVDNSGIVFSNNGVPFGSWDGVDFYTGNIVVQVNERAQFGNFAFIPRSDGSLMFLKVGG